MILVSEPLSKGTKFLLHTCITLNSFEIQSETTIKTLSLDTARVSFKKVNPLVSHKKNYAYLTTEKYSFGLTEGRRRN